MLKSGGNEIMKDPIGFLIYLVLNFVLLFSILWIRNK